MLLRPDFTFYLKGIRVRRYDLTQHNPMQFQCRPLSWTGIPLLALPFTTRTANHRFTAWEQRSSASGKRCTKN